MKWKMHPSGVKQLYKKNNSEHKKLSVLWWKSHVDKKCKWTGFIHLRLPTPLLLLMINGKDILWMERFYDKKKLQSHCFTFASKLHLAISRCAGQHLSTCKMASSKTSSTQKRENEKKKKTESCKHILCVDKYAVTHFIPSEASPRLQLC